jgi:hypothetical protein
VLAIKVFTAVASVWSLLISASSKVRRSELHIRGSLAKESAHMLAVCDIDGKGMKDYLKKQKSRGT